MRSILVTVPDDMKQQLDSLRDQKGYSLVGFCRSAIARALTQEPKTKTGVVTVRYRKPGGRLQRRRVSAPKLEKSVLKLEDEGAEILR